MNHKEELEHENEGLRAENQMLREQVQAVYRERNQAAMLAAVFAGDLGFPAGWGDDPDHPDWPVLYIDLTIGGVGRGSTPGQVSWHIPVAERLATASGLADYADVWDGSDDKSARIERFIQEYTK